MIELKGFEQYKKDLMKALNENANQPSVAVVFTLMFMNWNSSLINFCPAFILSGIINFQIMSNVTSITGYAAYTNVVKNIKTPTKSGEEVVKDGKADMLVK